MGLPEYSPGAADRNLLKEAMQKSEVQMIEDAMLHDKIKMTDFERTEQEISEQVTIQLSVISAFIPIRIYCEMNQYNLSVGFLNIF